MLYTCIRMSMSTRTVDVVVVAAAVACTWYMQQSLGKRQSKEEVIPASPPPPTSSQPASRRRPPRPWLSIAIDQASRALSLLKLIDTPCPHVRPIYPVIHAIHCRLSPAVNLELAGCQSICGPGGRGGGEGGQWHLSSFVSFAYSWMRSYQSMPCK